VVAGMRRSDLHTVSALLILIVAAF